MSQGPFFSNVKDNLVGVELQRLNFLWLQEKQRLNSELETERERITNEFSKFKYLIHQDNLRYLESERETLESQIYKDFNRAEAELMAEERAFRDYEQQTQSEYESLLSQVELLKQQLEECQELLRKCEEDQLKKPKVIRMPQVGVQFSETGSPEKYGGKGLLRGGKKRK